MIEDSIPAPTDGFSVRPHRSGRTIMVQPGDSILDTLLDAGVGVSFSCPKGCAAPARLG
jgi:vanillate O-demethylase ferredoxin subunit